MTFNGSAARKLNVFFFLTGIMSIRLDMKSATFVTKPMYLVLSFSMITIQTVYTLTIGIAKQFRSDRLSKHMFIDALAIFLRDSSLAFSFPVFIVLLHATRRHQRDFLNKTIALDRLMDDRFGLDPTASNRHYNIAIVKCTVWVMYYLLIVVPIEAYLYDFDFELNNLIYLCSFSLVAIEIGLGIAYIEFCVAIFFRQTERLTEVIADIFADYQRRKSAERAIQAIDMLREIDEQKLRFGASFSNVLHFICQIVTINSVFIAYLTLQNMSEDFQMVKLDNIFYFLPLIVRIYRLAGKMQAFGSKVSKVYCTYTLDEHFSCD